MMKTKILYVYIFLRPLIKIIIMKNMNCLNRSGLQKYIIVEKLLKG